MVTINKPRSARKKSRKVVPLRMGGATMHLARGSEGPRHDPYSYEELTVDGRNGETVIHIGLAVWITNDRMDLKVDDEKLVFDIFEKCVGVSFPAAMKAYHYVNDVLPYKLHAMRCDGRFNHGTGYPGESFNYCDKCNFVAGFHMDWSAIE